VAAWELTNRDALSFDLMTAGATVGPLDLTVELIDAAGIQVALPLSQFGNAPWPLPAHLVKADWLMGSAGYNMSIATPFEYVPQTYDLPLAAFSLADPRFQANHITGLRFTFAGTQGGDLYLDEVGFRRSP
jgi:hypothetical protein